MRTAKDNPLSVSCSECVFYEPQGELSGECRRMPPTGSRGEWPQVFHAQWCGEFARTLPVGIAPHRRAV